MDAHFDLRSWQNLLGVRDDIAYGMGEISGKSMELWVDGLEFELCLLNVNQFYEQSVWKANSFSANQEIYRLL